MLRRCQWMPWGVRLLAHVVEIKRKLYGEGHPDTLTDMKDLISMFATQGRWLDAEELLLHVLGIQTRVFGPEDLDTQDSFDDLAFIREQYIKSTAF
ncbi:hypothetical protein BDV27DRAFT_125371, partial [Aspergillus caelatus]